MSLDVLKDRLCVTACGPNSGRFFGSRRARMSMTAAQPKSAPIAGTYQFKGMLDSFTQRKSLTVDLAV